MAQLAPAGAASAFMTATVGAMAVGALAIGRALLRKLALKNAHAARVSFDDRRVRRTRMREFIRDDVPPPPIR